MADDGGRTPTGPRDNYYRNAASWAGDLNASAKASRNLAWWFAGAAALIAVLEAIALVVMQPLKTVVPYTILVDRQTGYVETVKGLQPGALTQDASVTQSFLVQYVIARETFDATDLRDNYHKIVIWSAGDARAQYQHEMQRSDANSPLNLYQATTVLSTTIKSVSLLSPNSALVRFDTTRHENGSASGEQRSWAAVIAFHYSAAPMRMGDRFLNPLGFQVTSYRRDAETAPGSAVQANLAAAAR